MPRTTLDAQLDEDLDDGLEELMDELIYPSLDPDHDLSWRNVGEDFDEANDDE